MAVDWDKNVLGPVEAVFGEPITYMPATGSPFSTSGVFDEAYHPVILLDNGPTMTTENPVLGVRASSFPSTQPPRKGDKLSIASVSSVFSVKDARPDGHGAIKLMLQFVSAMP